MAGLVDPDEFVDGEAKTIAEYRDRNVFAVRGGRITRVGWERPDDDEEGLGYRIWLKAPDGTQEVYGQMEPGSVLFRVGERVEEGAHLGRFAAGAPDSDVLYGVRDAEGNWLGPEDFTPSTEADAEAEDDPTVFRRRPRRPPGGRLFHGRCLDACASKDASKGMSWDAFCNSLPKVQQREQCRSHRSDSETACRGYCFNAWGKH
jgi:hypothetical protein